MTCPVNLVCGFMCVADAPNCRLFFTTDGSKPTPFQRKIGGREVTFKYIAPFSLKSGKRVVKAVCVSRYLTTFLKHNCLVKGRKDQ